jgi:hypothetical protein
MLVWEVRRGQLPGREGRRPVVLASFPVLAAGYTAQILVSLLADPLPPTMSVLHRVCACAPHLKDPAS